ncbi:MAG: hypothetical protein WDW36_005252 [Sanguina aurantia]
MGPADHGRSLTPSLTWFAGSLHLSPDASILAVLDSSHTSLWLFSSTQAFSSPQRVFSASCGGERSSERDVLMACGWAPDSSKLAIASASGNVYLLDSDVVPACPRRNGDLVQLLERCAAWARHLLVGLALLSPDKLLLLTQSAALLVVPLAAGPKALSMLRPKLLQPHHKRAHALAYDPATGVVVVAGDGDGSRPATSEISVSVWQHQEGQFRPVTATAPPKPRSLLASLFSPAPPSSPASPRHWSITFSPLRSEHVAVAAPGHPLVILSLSLAASPGAPSSGSLVDAGRMFAGGASVL